MSEPRSMRPSTWLRVRSSVIDRLAALVLGVVLAPVMALGVWRVRRGDGPPGIIALDRIGRHGTTFSMWKLRTMQAQAPSGAATGAVITASADARITPVGAALRRWRLDELPQLWNVLLGDMAILGPRPETPSLVDITDPRWSAVLAARPGITGPTQLVVQRWESVALTSDDPEQSYRDHILPVKLAIDQWYVEQSSLRVDLIVAWSMVERFVLGRTETAVDAIVRREVPEAATIPTGTEADG